MVGIDLTEGCPWFNCTTVMKLPEVEERSQLTWPRLDRKKGNFTIYDTFISLIYDILIMEAGLFQKPTRIKPVKLNFLRLHVLALSECFGDRQCLAFLLIIVISVLEFTPYIDASVSYTLTFVRSSDIPEKVATHVMSNVWKLIVVEISIRYTEKPSVSLHNACRMPQFSIFCILTYLGNYHWRRLRNWSCSSKALTLLRCWMESGGWR